MKNPAVDSVLPARINPAGKKKSKENSKKPAKKFYAGE